MGEGCTLIVMSIILKFQHSWERGLKVAEEAMLTLPKATGHHLIQHKLMFKSRLGKSVEGDIMMFGVSYNIIPVMSLKQLGLRLHKCLKSP